VVDVVPIDVCGIVFGSPYMYTRDAIVMTRENQYQLIKDENSFIINAHKGKPYVSLVSLHYSS